MEPGSDSRTGIAGADTTGELRGLGTGMTLGRYTLVRKIAAGGMAEVYAARSHGISGFEKKVAIKKILPQFSLNRRFVDMLVDEAKITVSLTHPNIAQIYELGLEGDTYYIVMEYVDGRPLNRLMQHLDLNGGESVPVVHAAHIMAEVTKGLHQAHNTKDHRGRQLEIVHRDVSPQNVLLAYSGDVKLIDFGIARAAGRAAQTSAGTIKGKLRYLAPEIAMGEEPDHRADVYCCGIVLFEMLTGEAMFAPRTDVEAIEMATAAKVRSPRASNRAVPQDLEDIVMKALRRDREQRYQSAKALYTDLRRFLNHYSPAYVGSELGDLMQRVFADAIAEDRRLDMVAETIIERMRSEDGDDTLGVKAGELAGVLPASEETRPGRYQQLVTRAGIDTGAADEHDEHEDASAEPTQRAVNPLSAGRDSAPTVTGPPPEPRGPSQPTLPGTGEVVLRPAAATATATITRPTPPRRRNGVTLFAAISLLIMVLGVWIGFASAPAPEPPPPPPPAPAPVPVASARLVVRVAPDVPVDLEVDGRIVERQISRRITLDRLEANRPHTIRVSAEGYAPFEQTQTLEPGGSAELSVMLQRLTGSVVLTGAEGARITADRGTVEGNTIVGVPVGETVEITVSRSGARRWRERVPISGTTGVEIAVPKPVLLPRGTLIVTSRPYAEVFVNGRSKGTTPVTLSVTAGRYKVTLQRSGGASWEAVRQVEPGKTTRVSKRWRR